MNDKNCKNCKLIQDDLGCEYHLAEYPNDTHNEWDCEKDYCSKWQNKNGINIEQIINDLNACKILWNDV